MQTETETEKHPPIPRYLKHALDVLRLNSVRFVKYNNDLIEDVKILSNLQNKRKSGDAFENAYIFTTVALQESDRISTMAKRVLKSDLRPFPPKYTYDNSQDSSNLQEQLTYIFTTQRRLTAENLDMLRRKDTKNIFYDNRMTIYKYDEKISFHDNITTLRSKFLKICRELFDASIHRYDMHPDALEVDDTRLIMLMRELGFLFNFTQRQLSGDIMAFDILNGLFDTLIVVIKESYRNNIGNILVDDVSEEELVHGIGYRKYLFEWLNLRVISLLEDGIAINEEDYEDIYMVLINSLIYTYHILRQIKLKQRINDEQSPINYNAPIYSRFLKLKA